jgi:phosphoribosyl 1,2-cyclic phosphodiesterase
VTPFRSSPLSKLKWGDESTGQQSLFDGGPPPPTLNPPDAEPRAVRPAPVVPPGTPPLRIGVLGSGSGGNSVIVEAGPHRLLIDAGFSCREIVKRAKSLNFDPGTLGAVVLTHEHQDHNRGIEVLANRYRLPVYATQGTLYGSGFAGTRVRKTVVIRSGEPVEAAGFLVEPFAIPHDALEPVGVVVQDPWGRRMGLVADIGYRSSLAWGRLCDLDMLILETNHDLDMLRNGPYPWSLKQRVAGRHGHLSNHDAAEGLPELLGDRLQWVVLYHLSQTNNLPTLAADAIGAALDREGCSARLAVTEQDRPTPWLEVTS